MHYPLKPFDSPFIGKSVDDIYNIFVEKIRGPGDKSLPDFAFWVFAILDEQTAKDKSTCLIVSDAPDGSNQIGPKKWAYRTVWTEFANSLYRTVTLDHMKLSILKMKEQKDGKELITWRMS